MYQPNGQSLVIV